MFTSDRVFPGLPVTPVLYRTNSDKRSQKFPNVSQKNLKHSLQLGNPSFLKEILVKTVLKIIIWQYRKNSTAEL